MADWPSSIGDKIVDADNNTQIQVEKSTNEDIIRFDTAGTERAQLDGTSWRLYKAAGGVLLDGIVTGEANPRVRLQTDKLEFGAGGASVLDTSVSRVVDTGSIIGLAVNRPIRLDAITMPTSIPASGIWTGAEDDLLKIVVSVGGTAVKFIPGQFLMTMFARGQFGAMVPSGASAIDLELIGIAKTATQTGGTRTLDADGLYINYQALTTESKGIVGDNNFWRKDGRPWLQFKFRIPTLLNCRVFIGFTDQTIATMCSTPCVDSGIYNGLMYEGLGDSGTADAAVSTTTTTLTDTRKSYPNSYWVGATVTCNGKTMVVTSQLGNVFTGSAGWSAGGDPGDGFAWSIGERPSFIWIRRDGTTRTTTTPSVTVDTAIHHARIATGVGGNTARAMILSKDFVLEASGAVNSNFNVPTTPLHYMAGLFASGATRNLHIWRGDLISDGP